LFCDKDSTLSDNLLNSPTHGNSVAKLRSNIL